MFLSTSSLGPWLTFEIQLPQDDFHLLAWVMGTKVSEDELPGLKEDYHLRGLISQEHLLQGLTIVCVLSSQRVECMHVV